MPAFVPRTIGEFLDIGTTIYVANDGDPLRVIQGGDMYTLLRAVANVLSNVHSEAYFVQQNAFLSTCLDEDECARHINPYGIYREQGKPSTGGIVAVAKSGASSKALPVNSVFQIGTQTYLSTAAVLLTAPWQIVPVVATQVGTSGDKAAGLEAQLLNAPTITAEYDFYVGTLGLNAQNQPYGDINAGVDLESLDSFKDRYFQTFNNSGQALARVLYTTALAVSGVRAASVLTRTPAPGYVTVYIDDGSSVTPQALLDTVKTELYKKASAGEYLIVTAMAKELVNLRVTCKIDGSIIANQARQDIQTFLNSYLYDFKDGQSLYRLFMDEQMDAFAYVLDTTYEIFDSITSTYLPFSDKIIQPGKVIRPGTLDVVITL